MNVSAEEAYDMVLYQIGALAGFATACGGKTGAREAAWRALQHGGERRKTGTGHRAGGKGFQIRGSSCSDWPEANSFVPAGRPD